MRKIAILGFGAEGKALQKYFNGKAAVLDKKRDKNYLRNLGEFEIVFRSPGIPYLTPEIQKAKRAGVKISSATKLFFESASRRSPAVKVIGITGTKGKGTTATLLSKILKTGGKKIFLVGNIGAPAISFLPRLTKNSLVVFELSSFQLQDLNQSPQVAVVLDISPDHLNSHKNFEEYWRAKANIAKHQTKKGLVIFASDNPWSAKIAAAGRRRKIGFSLADKNPLLAKIRNALKLPGEHNLKNAYAAALAAKALGIPENLILKTIRNFRGLPYRLQLINKRPTTYNDSASTNPEAAIAAIKAVNPTILIMGGVNKGLSYNKLSLAIKHSTLRTIFLYGQNRFELKKALAKISAKIILKNTLREIMKGLNADKNEVILFSPASASLDQFKNYQDRGKAFNRLKLQY